MKHSKHYDNLCEAAEYYGLDLQMDKLIEEMGELLALLGRMNIGREVRRAELAGELADVYNILNQVCMLLDMEDEVQDEAERKMARTVQRIREAAEDAGCEQYFA